MYISRLLINFALLIVLRYPAIKWSLAIPPPNIVYKTAHTVTPKNNVFRI